MAEAHVEPTGCNPGAFVAARDTWGPHTATSLPWRTSAPALVAAAVPGTVPQAAAAAAAAAAAPAPCLPRLTQLERPLPACQSSFSAPAQLSVSCASRLSPLPASCQQGSTVWPARVTSSLSVAAGAGSSSVCTRTVVGPVTAGPQGGANMLPAALGTGTQHPVGAAPNAVSPAAAAVAAPPAQLDAVVLPGPCCVAPSTVIPSAGGAELREDPSNWSGAGSLLQYNPPATPALLNTCPTHPAAAANSSIQTPWLCSHSCPAASPQDRQGPSVSAGAAAEQEVPQHVMAAASNPFEGMAASAAAAAAAAATVIVNRPAALHTADVAGQDSTDAAAAGLALPTIPVEEEGREGDEQRCGQMCDAGMQQALVCRLCSLLLQEQGSEPLGMVKALVRLHDAGGQLPVLPHLLAPRLLSAGCWMAQVVIQMLRARESLQPCKLCTVGALLDSLHGECCHLLQMQHQQQQQGGPGLASTACGAALHGPPPHKRAAGAAASAPVPMQEVQLLFATAHALMCQHAQLQRDILLDCDEGEAGGEEPRWEELQQLGHLCVHALKRLHQALHPLATPAPWDIGRGMASPHMLATVQLGPALNVVDTSGGAAHCRAAPVGLMECSTDVASPGADRTPTSSFPQAEPSAQSSGCAGELQAREAAAEAGCARTGSDLAVVMTAVAVAQPPHPRPCWQQLLEALAPPQQRQAAVQQLRVYSEVMEAVAAAAEIEAEAEPSLEAAMLVVLLRLLCLLAECGDCSALAGGGGQKDAVQWRTGKAESPAVNATGAGHVWEGQLGEVQGHAWAETREGEPAVPEGGWSQAPPAKRPCSRPEGPGCDAVGGLSFDSGNKAALANAALLATDAACTRIPVQPRQLAVAEGHSQAVSAAASTDSSSAGGLSDGRNVPVAGAAGLAVHSRSAVDAETTSEAVPSGGGGGVAAAEPWLLRQELLGLVHLLHRLGAVVQLQERDKPGRKTIARGPLRRLQQQVLQQLVHGDPPAALLLADLALGHPAMAKMAWLLDNFASGHTSVQWLADVGMALAQVVEKEAAAGDWPAAAAAACQVQGLLRALWVRVHAENGCTRSQVRVWQALLPLLLRLADVCHSAVMEPDGWTTPLVEELRAAPHYVARLLHCAFQAGCCLLRSLQHQVEQLVNSTKAHMDPQSISRWTPHACSSPHPTPAQRTSASWHTHPCTMPPPKGAPPPQTHLPTSPSPHPSTPTMDPEVPPPTCQSPRQHAARFSARPPPSASLSLALQPDSPQLRAARQVVRLLMRAGAGHCGQLLAAAGWASSKRSRQVRQAAELCGEAAGGLGAALQELLGNGWAPRHKRAVGSLARACVLAASEMAASISPAPAIASTHTTPRGSALAATSSPEDATQTPSLLISPPAAATPCNRAASAYHHQHPSLLVRTLPHITPIAMLAHDLPSPPAVSPHLLPGQPALPPPLSSSLLQHHSRLRLVGHLEASAIVQPPTSSAAASAAVPPQDISPAATHAVPCITAATHVPASAAAGQQAPRCITPIPIPGPVHPSLLSTKQCFTTPAGPGCTPLQPSHAGPEPGLVGVRSGIRAAPLTPAAAGAVAAVEQFRGGRPFKRRRVALSDSVHEDVCIPGAVGVHTKPHSMQAARQRGMGASQAAPLLPQLPREPNLEPGVRRGSPARAEAGFHDWAEDPLGQPGGAPVPSLEVQAPRRRPVLCSSHPALLTLPASHAAPPPTPADPADRCGAESSRDRPCTEKLICSMVGVRGLAGGLGGQQKGSPGKKRQSLRPKGSEYGSTVTMPTDLQEHPFLHSQTGSAVTAAVVSVVDATKLPVASSQHAASSCVWRSTTGVAGQHLTLGVDTCGQKVSGSGAAGVSESGSKFAGVAERAWTHLATASTTAAAAAPAPAPAPATATARHIGNGLSTVVPSLLPSTVARDAACNCGIGLEGGGTNHVRGNEQSEVAGMMVMAMENELGHVEVSMGSGLARGGQVKGRVVVEGQSEERRLGSGCTVQTAVDPYTFFVCEDKVMPGGRVSWTQGAGWVGSRGKAGGRMGQDQAVRGKVPATAAGGFHPRKRSTADGPHEASQGQPLSKCRPGQAAGARRLNLNSGYVKHCLHVPARPRMATGAADSTPIEWILAAGDVASTASALRRIQAGRRVGFGSVQHVKTVTAVRTAGHPGSVGIPNQQCPAGSGSAATCPPLGSCRQVPAGAGTSALSRHAAAPLQPAPPRPAAGLWEEPSGQQQPGSREAAGQGKLQQSDLERVYEDVDFNTSMCTEDSDDDRDGNWQPSGGLARSSIRWKCSQHTALHYALRARRVRGVASRPEPMLSHHPLVCHKEPSAAGVLQVSATAVTHVSETRGTASPSPASLHATAATQSKPPHVGPNPVLCNMQPLHSGGLAPSLHSNLPAPLPSATAALPTAAPASPVSHIVALGTRGGVRPRLTAQLPAEQGQEAQLASANKRLQPTLISKLQSDTCGMIGNAAPIKRGAASGSSGTGRTAHASNTAAQQQSRAVPAATAGSGTRTQKDRPQLSSRNPYVQAVLDMEGSGIGSAALAELEEFIATDADTDTEPEASPDQWRHWIQQQFRHAEDGPSASESSVLDSGTCPEENVDSGQVESFMRLFSGCGSRP